MTQTTRVYQVAPGAVESLETSLREGLPPDAQWRRVPHARFSVKAEDVVLTCYRSGKLVVQGRNLEMFGARHLPGLVAKESAQAKQASQPELRLGIGSDEAGKGDYFGPLVVAAVFVAPADAAFLAKLRVADSKTLSDLRVRVLAGRLQERLDVEIVSLMPAEYNRRYAECGNLNRLLATLHARVLQPLISRHPGVQVTVDRFAADELVLEALRSGADALPPILQVPRAEVHPPVAAASVLARNAFLDGLAESEDISGSDLHKGAGRPVDVAARRVFAIGGRDLLSRVAKLHFKNTAKIGTR